jgi:hypothetical protein
LTEVRALATIKTLLGGTFNTEIPVYKRVMALLDQRFELLVCHKEEEPHRPLWVSLVDQETGDTITFALFESHEQTTTAAIPN